MRQGAPLVTFRPVARLGNILFELAACIGYAKTHNVGWGVPRHIPEVPKFHEYFPGLPICEDNFRSYQEHPDNQHCPVHNCGKDQCWYNHHEIPFHPSGVKLAGFFQSWKYFDHAQGEVRAAFKLKEIPGLMNAIGCHIRRGDYVQHANSFPPVTKEYVFMALEKFIPTDLRRVIFFSDDLQWCREVFGDMLMILGNQFTVEYSKGHDDFIDLSAMASCHSNIIANSSYSFWAAWLNRNPDKIVVSPSCVRGNWFGITSGVLTDCVDLLPPDWIQIKFR